MRKGKFLQSNFQMCDTKGCFCYFSNFILVFEKNELLSQRKDLCVRAWTMCVVPGEHQHWHTCSSQGTKYLLFYLFLNTVFEIF